MDLLKELEGAKKIGISGHVRPDGDCVGACLSMKRYLENAKIDAEITLFLQKPSDDFNYLAGFYDINSSFVGINDFDVYIALDCGDTLRLGDAEPFFKRAKKTICIDHHVSNIGYGNVSVVVPDASSTCEILYDLFDKKYIDDEVAKCLYTGIVHDTGVFQYSNTSKKTFNIIGELTEYNFSGSDIIDESFYQKTYKQNQILGRVLTESILFMDGKCIAGVMTQKMMKFYDADPLDLEGIVSQLRVTKGVEVAIFLHEMYSGEFKVSLRSNGKVDVAKVCLYYGGGGHVRAAGCKLSGTYYDVLNNISKLIEAQLNEMEEG